jgi:micrococcal nuclease
MVGVRRAALLAAPLLLGACARAAIVPIDERATTQARIERVVDGDTVIVRLEGKRTRVRLLGIDTPESVKPGAPVECFGRESAAEAKRLLVPGATVLLEFDRDREDRYERTLAYVYRAEDDLFVNETLVARGFARTLSIEPNDAHASELARAERDARAARLGIWKACAP